MEQMMQRLLAKMDANQAKTDANLKEIKVEFTARLEAKIEPEIKTNNKKYEVPRRTVDSRMDIHLARPKAIQKEIIAKMDVHQERMGASANACQEATEACLESKEPTSVEMHEEVPKDEAAVKTVNRTEGAACSLRAPPTTEETDAGRW
jgi:hypothetical protein